MTAPVKRVRPQDAFRCNYEEMLRQGSVIGTPLERGWAVTYDPAMTKRSPFKYFKTSPEIIRLAAMLYVRFTEGTLLFSGLMSNGRLSGVARRFLAKCGENEYQVRGPAVGTTVVLEGNYVRRGDACQALGERLDRLEFNFISETPLDLR